MHLLTLPIRLFRRFFSGQYSQTAAALSFATLLGLVPMIAVAAAVLSHLPLADAIAASIQKFLMANLLPDKAGSIIAKYVSRFALKARHLTWVGLGALAMTAIAQMLTVEHAFNGIWNVRENRPLAKRVAMHLLVLIFGPLVFGGSFAITTYIAGASLGLIEEWRSLTSAVFKMLSFAFVSGMFALIYWKVPNRPVAGGHALVGGLLAAAGFSSLQWLFAGYIAEAASYHAMYGTFAVIPIFLLWLYLSWSVILAGALTTADLGGVMHGGRR
ncbi:MAG: YihY family inner membrane protein [Georgfuchsia sp.]